MEQRQAASQIFFYFFVLFVIGWLLVQRLFPGFMVSYLFLSASIGFALYRLPYDLQRETLSSFFLYNKQMPRRMFVTTLVTTNVGFFSSIAFSVVLIFTMGIGAAIIAVIAWIFGLYWFSRHISSMLPFFQRGSTIHEYIGETYGKTADQKIRLRLSSSIITFLLYVASIGVEIKFTADVFSIPTSISPAVLAVFLGMTGVFYVAASGYKGVVGTDWLQFWCMILGVPAIFAFLYILVRQSNASFDIPLESISSVLLSPDPLTLLSVIILLAMYQFCVMDMWQRCIAVVNSDTLLRHKAGGKRRDQDIARELKKMLVWESAIPFVLLFSAWYGIGLVALAQSWTDNPTQIINVFIDRISAFGATGILPALLLTAIVICFLAAALSTIDGFLIAAVQTLVYDWRLFFSAKAISIDDMNERQIRPLLIWSRILVIAVGMIAISLAYLSFDLLSFWVGMYSLMLSFFPAIFMSLVRGKEFASGRSSLQVELSIIVGSLVALVLAILGAFIYKDPTVSAASALVGVLVSMMILLPRFGRA